MSDELTLSIDDEGDGESSDLFQSDSSPPTGSLISWLGCEEEVSEEVTSTVLPSVGGVRFASMGFIKL